jgi:hypothetical protein
MGGKGPSACQPPQPLPPAPAPIDYDKMAAASIRVANAQIAAEQRRRSSGCIPQYTKLQFQPPTNFRASSTTNTSPALAVWSVRS